MARTLKSVEIWSDVEANGGTRQVVVPDWTSYIDRFDLEGRDVLELELRRKSIAWDAVDHRKVLRGVLEDEDGVETVQEWRIGDIDDRMDGGGGLTASVPAESILYDLGSTIVEKIEADGRAHSVFTLLDLTPSEHVDFILGHAPSYFSKGTIDPTIATDLQYSSDSPLSALQELAEIADAELEVTRNGVTDYQVHLRTEIASTQEKVYLRDAKNVRSVERRRKGSKIANRVFPRGETVDGVQATMAEAHWEVASVSGSVVTLKGDPVRFDDQLNGYYLEKTNGALTQVTDSDASADTVTVADATNISAGDEVVFRKNAAGDDLTFLDEPSSQSSYGVVERFVERPDIPLIENLVSNPFLSAWTAGSPDDWSAIGAPTISEETAADNQDHGGSSAKVVAADGEGIKTASIPISPTATKPFFSAQLRFRIESGAVSFRIVDETNTREYPPEDSDFARADVTGRWIERLAIEGIDLREVSATSVRLEIKAVGGAATFYLDAAQLEQEAVSARNYWPGRASNDLWEIANDTLDEKAQPPIEYDVDLIDLHEVDGTEFGFDELVKGGTVQLIHDDLGIDVETRIVAIERERGHPGVARVTLDEVVEGLSSRLGKQRRRPLAGLSKELGTENRLASFISAKAWIDSDGDTHLHYKLNAPTGLSVKFLVSTTSQPTRGDTIDTGTVIDQTSVDNQEISTGDAPNFGDSVFVTVVAFSGSNAGGFPGEAWASGEIEVSTSGAQLSDGSVIASKLIESAQKFGSDIDFNNPDWDTVNWTTGTIETADGTTYSINSNGTGDLGDDLLHYVYLDTDVSTTELQTTTTLSDTQGDNKFLLAVLKRAPTASQQAFVIPAVGEIGLNRDHIAVSSISTSRLQTNSVTAAKISVSQLSAISANIGTVTAGTVEANVVIAAKSFTATNSEFSGTVDIMESGTAIGRLQSSAGVFVVTATDHVSFQADVSIVGLPTADPGIADRLWNDGGTVKVSSG